MNSSKEAFLDKVCEMVSFKEAHSSIRQELEMHIEDLAESYLEEGYEEHEATGMAVQSMGNPHKIGEQLNKTHNGRIQWQVVISTICLSFIGLITLFFIGELPYRNGIIFGKRQLISMTVGALVILTMYHINYRKLISNSKFLYLIGVLLTAATVLFGTEVNGFRFLQIGFISFEPAKFYNILFLICIIGILEETGGKFIFNLLEIVTYMLIALFCLYKITDIGMVITMAIVYLSIITLVICKYHFSFMNRKICFAAAYGFALSAPILIYIFLKGKMAVLSDTWVDFQFSIMASRFGEQYIIIVIALLSILIGSMILSTARMKSWTALYLSTSIVTYLITNCMLSLIIGFGLLDGVRSNIAFISFGGSNYISDCILIGLFLSMWRRNNIINGDIHPSHIKSITH